MQKLKWVNLPGVLFFAAVLLAWQLLAVHMQTPNFPAPSAIAKAMAENAGTIAGEALPTLRRALFGFLLALAIMLPLGIAMGRVRWLGAAFGPVVEMVRPLPPIAVVPMAMLFFGTGDAAKIAVIFYGAAFPILINAMDAVRAQHPMSTLVARSLRLSTAERMWHMDLPSSLPQIFAGIRISVAWSVLLSVVSEMLLSTDGLGAFLVQAQQRFEISKGLGALVVIALIALVVNAVMLRIDRTLLAWHHARHARPH